MITHLDSDILECEVKWTLGSITTNKASGGDGIPVELFQILKDDAMKVLPSICQEIWKPQQWPQYWKKSVFIPIPKKGNAKECSNYRTIALFSHASKVMLKILQARLQQYVKCELPNVQTGFRKGRGIRIKRPTSTGSKKQKSSRKTSTSALLTMPIVNWLCGSQLCGSHNWSYGSQATPENPSRDGNTRSPDLPSEEVYAGQEATVRTEHGTTDWFQIERSMSRLHIVTLLI